MLNKMKTVTAPADHDSAKAKTNLKENMTMNYKNYINNFQMSKFMLENGLYIAILIFFIVFR